VCFGTASSRLHLPHTRIIALVNAIKALPHLEIMHITPSLDDAAWALLKARPDKEWSLVDAASFVLMRDYGMTEALTTDHHFTQAGFTRLPAPSAP
jgi:predicted nucleic acid-binding protein